MYIKKLSLSAIFAALIAVGAFVKIPMTPVSITLQSFFVLLSGVLLGSKWAVTSVFVYIALGLLGFPVFLEGGGILYVLKPTFGFLIGFLVTGFCSGFFIRDKSITIFKLYLSLIPMYIIGIFYYIIAIKLFSGIEFKLPEIIYTSYIFFIPSDIIKCVAVKVLGKKLRIILNNKF